jgi:hypothetical protein
VLSHWFAPSRPLIAVAVTLVRSVATAFRGGFPYVPLALHSSPATAAVAPPAHGGAAPVQLGAAVTPPTHVAAQVQPAPQSLLSLTGAALQSGQRGGHPSRSRAEAARPNIWNDDVPRGSKSLGCRELRLVVSSHVSDARRGGLKRFRGPGSTGPARRPVRRRPAAWRPNRGTTSRSSCRPTPC